MSAKEISIARASDDKLFYFVANVLVVRKSDMRCLLLQRSATEKVHPGKWATPGGKMEHKDFDLTRPSRMNGEVLDFFDSIENLLRRETHEEAGITLGDDFRYLYSMTFVRPDGIPVVMVKMAALYDSGEVVLEKGSFDDSVWVTEEEAKALDCVEGICEEVRGALQLFKEE